MRRQTLISITVIGTAMVLAGASTTALFNDTETSEDNMFQTGAIDLKVDWNESYNGDHVETQKLTDNPGPIFSFKDLKPGDHGEATVSLHVKDNPAWVWMRAKTTQDREVIETEPETSMGDTDPDGELNDELIFTIWRDDGDNVLEDGEKVIKQGTLRSMQSELHNGVMLGGFESSETEYIGIKWEIPREVGNRIQKDRIKMDFEFYAEQQRHNDEPANPWTDETVNPEPPEEPPSEPASLNPKFTGCSSAVVYSSEQGSEFEIVTWVNGSYETQMVQTSEADETFQPSHSNFGSGQDGVIGYKYDFDKTVGVTNGEDFVNPNFDVESENCSNSTGITDGNQFNWGEFLEVSYTVTQAGETYEIQPLEGNMTVEELYDYRLPQQFDHENQTLNGATYPGSGPNYQSAGTTDLQQQETSIMFLYDGPEGLSLVTVHDKAGGDGGSTTWEITGLNSGQWVVKDDLYLDSNGQKAGSNYDDWNVGSEPQVINWTWGGGGTDGGAYRDLGETFSFTIDPAFNEESPIYEQHYSGEIDEWQVLSGDISSPDRTTLNMTETVTVSAN